MVCFESKITLGKTNESFSGDMMKSKQLAKRRDVLMTQLEKTRREIYEIDLEINREGLIEDPTLLNAIEKSKELYDKGNFKAIRNWLSKGLDTLDSDRYYSSLKVEDVNLDELAGEMYLLPNPFGIREHSIYGLPIVIGGWPGSRKTSLAVQAFYWDYLFKRPAAFFTFELTPSQLLAKIIQIHVAHTHGEDLSFSNVNRYVKEHKEEIDAFVKDFLQIMFVIESNGFSGAKLSSVYERLTIATPSLRVLYIDYFQRLRPDFHTKKGNEDTRTGYMTTSRILTDLAKRTSSVMVVLSQLNAEGGFKETGAILEDAGMAIKINKSDRPTYLYLEVIKSRFSKMGAVARPAIKEVSGYVTG